MSEQTPEERIAELEAQLAVARGAATQAPAEGPATEPTPNALVVGQLVAKDEGTEHESHGIVLALVASEENEGLPGPTTYSAPAAVVGWFASASTLPESALATVAAE
jgi:hypothetical protein